MMGKGMKKNREQGRMGKINDAPQKSKKEKARKERKKERKKAQSFGGTTDAVAEGLGLLGATA
ncbi:MAG TPA: hypothetical protein DCG20_03350 [Prevotella sp.]|nr:hypothetical protein [Prevotella sp.]